MKRCKDQQAHQVILPAHVFAKVQRYARREHISLSKAMDRLSQNLETVQVKED